METYLKLQKVIRSDFTNLNVIELQKSGLVKKITHTQYVITEKGMLTMLKFESEKS